ncbi:MAG: hypothetical protein BRD42_08830 [Bacteroidetes bacterium QS_3_64_15]|nr:MAG: hypothetical protein BRD42_08830 [Bacteroidetes bacterium QS_3_64_15]
MQWTFSFRPQQDTDTRHSTPPVHTRHVHDLEAALAASIGRNFDVLSRQFRKAWSKAQRTDPPRS